MKRLAVLAALTLSLIAAPASADGQACASMIAHRGGYFAGTTENGMAALAQSAARGVGRFEVDVRTSADDTLWVMHDATLDRTTSSRGAVANMTDRRLSRVRLDDGGRVPRVAHVLRHAKRSGLTPVLHMKWMTEKSWDRLRARLRDHAMVTRAVLLVGPKHAARSERELPRTRKIMMYDPTAHTIPPYVAGVSAHESTTTRATVARVRRRGLEYWVYTPVAQHQWDELHSWGADVMLINNVDDYLATCG